MRLVMNDGSIMMGPTHAVSMPYDMIGVSLTDAIAAMKQSNSSTK